MRPLLLHIGYHKTGTKWLQRFVFDSEEIGFASPFRRGEDVGERLIGPHPLDFDPRPAREYFHALLEPYTDATTIPVLSHERLSGHPHSGGYDSRELADRLAAVFPDARVLIVIREQRRAVVSAYQQYVRAGGAGRPEDYLDPPDLGRNRMPAFEMEHFAYDRLVRYYRGLFGPDRVRVLAYEQFRRDGVAYVDRIVRFAGAEPTPGAIETLPFGRRVNASESFLSIAIRRRTNALFGRSRFNPSPVSDRPGLHAWIVRRAGSLDRVVPDRLLDALGRRTHARAAELVGDRFRESNRRLARLVDFDLDELGYTL